jgi:Glyoxalase/Bleomycin resistance protein/Dioxygenase superfamily
MRLGQFLQIGIVVEDVKTSVKAYEEFGFGPWEIQDFDGTKISGFKDHGQPSDLAFKGAVCQHHGVEIELIQPVSESIFSEWLRTRGPGVHHVAFVPLEGFTAFMQEFQAGGNGTIMEGLFGDGDRGFAYLDTLKQLGFYSEIHKGRPG